MADLAISAGLDRHTVYLRWHRGERDVEALIRPAVTGSRIVLSDGRSLVQAARDAGLPVPTVRARWRKGIRSLDVLLAPSSRRRTN